MATPWLPPPTTHISNPHFHNRISLTYFDKNVKTEKLSDGSPLSSPRASRSLHPSPLPSLVLQTEELPRLLLRPVFWPKLWSPVIPFFTPSLLSLALLLNLIIYICMLTMLMVTMLTMLPLPTRFFLLNIGNNDNNNNKKITMVNNKQNKK